MSTFLTEESIKELNGLAELCYGLSASAGWWDSFSDEHEGAYLSQKLVLIHSEVSEAMEGLRKGIPDDKLPHRSMEEVEMADALIRIFDYCGKRGFDIGGAITEKLAFNQSRADHKLENRAKAGGKKF